MKCAFLGSWADNISSFCSFYYMGISKQIPFMGGKENSTTYNGYFSSTEPQIIQIEKWF